MKFIQANRGFSLCHKLDPQEVGEFLFSLGNVETEAVVKAATPKTSPLHKYFEWDDAKCGHAHRLSQARHLILSIRIEAEDESSVPAMGSVVLNSQRQWVPTPEIAKDEDLVDQVLVSALKELRRWGEKHQELKKYFGGVFDAIKIAEAELGRKSEENSKGRESGSRGGIKVNHPSNKKANRDGYDSGGITPPG